MPKTTRYVPIAAIDRLTTQRMITEVLGHEFVHAGASGGSDIVSRVLDFAERAFTPEVVEKMRDDTAATYVKFYTRLYAEQGMPLAEAESNARAICTPDFIDEEVAGDVMRSVFRETGALYQMAKDEPGIVKDLRALVAQARARIQRVLPGKGEASTYAKIMFNEADAITRKLDRALKKYGESVTVSTEETDPGDDTVSPAESMREAQSVQEQRHSVESDALIEELGGADKDDYSTLTTEQQSRLWNIPEIRNVREEKFTKTIALPGRAGIRDSAYETLMGRGAWDGTGYGAPVRRDRRADIVIGLPGSGKSSTAVNPLSQKHGSRVIDSDMAKELLPEYDNGRGAKMVHEESSAVRDRVYDETVARGENFVLATVGADIGKIEGYIDGLHDAGYTVGLHYVDVTPKQAAQRMLSRFLPDGTPSGRYTPPDVLLSAGNFPQDTYNRLLTRGVADEYQKYDNRNTRAEDRVSPESDREPGGFSERAADVRPGERGAGGMARGGGYDGRATGETLDVPPRSVQPGAGENSVRARSTDKSYDRYAPDEPLFGLEGGITRKELSRINGLKSFQKWFKDGNGELRDSKTGLPVVVFHGTSTAGYTRFIEQASGEPGFWFAGHPNTSASPYYLNTEDPDARRRAFIPEALKTWDQADEYVFRVFPNLELSQEVDESGNDVFVVYDADDGAYLGEYTADDTGLKKFDRELQDLSAMAWEKQNFDGRVQGGSPGVYQTFLSMERPLVVYGEGASWNRLSPFMADKKDVQEYLSRAVSDEDGILPAVTKLLPQRETYLATRDFVNAAEELGYDGVIFRDIQDGRAELVPQNAESEDLYQKALAIIENNGNFGAPSPEQGVAYLEVVGVPDDLPEADKAVLNAYLSGQSTIPSGVSRETEVAMSGDAVYSEVPDDVYVVFSSNQIKSVNNTGRFSSKNPDIRYSVDTRSPFREQVETALKEPDSENRYTSLYITLMPCLVSSQLAARRLRI